MDESLQTYTISQLREKSPSLDEFGLGNDIFFCEIKGSEIEKSASMLAQMAYPVRIDAYMCCFCKRGRFRIDLNLQSYVMAQNMLFVNIPGNITSFTLDEDMDLKDVELVMILLSRDFVSNVRFDFKKSFHDSVKLLNVPCIRLTQEQVDIASDYFNLARKIVHAPLSDHSGVIGSLLSSLSYVMADILQTNAPKDNVESDPRSARLNQVFDRFISLVTEYHTSERNMAFYAQRMNLTPKYLSKLVRQASGRSAPEWIDSFVILEAKNMLRYSDCSIKEIVYHLHFPNQSVFYKFFKSHTGMTPSEYRNS